MTTPFLQTEALRTCGFHILVHGSNITVSLLDGSGFEKRYSIDGFSASVVVEDFGDFKYGRGADDQSDGNRCAELY